MDDDIALAGALDEATVIQLQPYLERRKSLEEMKPVYDAVTMEDYAHWVTEIDWDELTTNR